jgi:linoleoyl-CoA desaturase
METIIFSQKSSGEVFFTEIRQQVSDYLEIHSTTEKTKLLPKVLVFTMMLIFSFTGILFSVNFAMLFCCYVVFGFSALLIALNFAHDASHRALPLSRFWNDRLYELIFILLGANPYLWKIRHTQSHHLFANIYGADADLEDSLLIRLSPEVPYYKIHRFQHIYAPVLYLFYTLVWVFYKDFATFFKSKIGNLETHNHPPKEFVKLILFKLLYIVIWLLIPAFICKMSFYWIIIAFFLTHFLMSLFLIFTFLLSHFVEETVFPERENNQITGSWATHQLDVCIDFHPEAAWANWVFGGFNTHLAHHLFPNVCHIHYPSITRRLQIILKRHQLPYKSVSFGQGIISHLRFLKKMGNP